MWPRLRVIGIRAASVSGSLMEPKWILYQTREDQYNTPVTGAQEQFCLPSCLHNIVSDKVIYRCV